MIPPLQPIRLRSIKAWLKGRNPTMPQSRLDSRALEMDEQMMEAFESREDVLKEQMMRNKTWGTWEGMEQFPMGCMMLWQEIVQDFLPTFDPPLED